jgi:putative phage-type endonuclease
MIEQIYTHIEQGSDEWHAARLGHVSASSVSDVMSKGRTEGAESETRKSYRLKIVAQRLTGASEGGYTNAAMEWGTEQEPFARMAYEAARDVLVDKTGFWLHPTIPWVGVSPDGLVGDDGLVEIKCPNTTTHLEWVFAGKVPAKHMKQIQCQMWVTGRKWCDFVSYDPRLPARNQLFIVRVPRDENLIATMEAEVVKFLAEVDAMIELLNKE